MVIVQRISTIKLTRNEGSILEISFWEMIFGSEDVLPLYGFLKTNFMMVTKLKDSLTLDDNDDDADFRYSYRDTMITQFKQDLYTRTSSHQDQDKRDDGLQKIFEFWVICVIVNEAAPTPDNIYEHHCNEPGLSYFFRGSKYNPLLRKLKKFLINDSENK